jgi:hypothetical protein
MFYFFFNFSILSGNKLSVKRMKLTVCEECTSSSDDDQWPILSPPSSSASSDDSANNLSPIEEEKCAPESSSSESSKYLSSFLDSSVTTISGTSDDESSSCYKPLHDDTATLNNDPRPTNVSIPESAIKFQNERRERVESARSTPQVDIDEIGFEPLTRQVIQQNEESVSTHPYVLNV